MTAPLWIVVSARMASSRCPGKALAPLAGRPLLEVLLDRMAGTSFFLPAGLVMSGQPLLAPDGSPLLVRDIGTQEIYALDWEAP